MNSNPEMVVTYDCDDTLVMWHKDIKDVNVNDPYGPVGSQIALKKHNKHIKLLKNHKAQGYFIIVWSAAGKLWADAVVEALDLKDYVDLTLAKPVKYVDDLPASEILGSRIYLSDENEP